MKNYLKIIITLTFVLNTNFIIGQQVLNTANWPNTDWSITGSYTTTALTNNPTLTSNFSFDDNLAGSTSLFDQFAAVSPIIDLNPAVNAGELQIQLTLNYIYRSNGDALTLEYWNPDGNLWEIWEEFEQTSSSDIAYKSCAPFTTFTSVPLPISTFTATQLLSFKYRLRYNDNGWSFGFCFGSPTLKSIETPECIAVIDVVIDSSLITNTEAVIDWMDINLDTPTNGWEIEYGSTGFIQGTGTTVSSISKPYTVTNLTDYTFYDVYIRALCENSNSDWSEVTTFKTLGSPICGGQFIDSGGPNEQYTSSENETVTIFPSQAGEVVTAQFLEFDLDKEGYDKLTIYNGDSTSAPLLGIFSEKNIPPTFTSTHSSGCLTFVFTSDNSVVGDGWIANIICNTPPSCYAPINIEITDITFNSATVSWNDSNFNIPNATIWEIDIVPIGTSPVFETQVSVNTNYSITGLQSGTEYECYIKAKCNDTNYSFWSKQRFITLGCEIPDVEYGYDFTNNELVFNLHYDNPILFGMVDKWTIEWGVDSDISDFQPGTGTEVDFIVVDSQTTSIEANAQGNFEIRIDIPFSEIYDSSTDGTPTLKYSFHLLTECKNNLSSSWLLIGNHSKYIDGIGCIDSDSIQINFETLTQPISQFQIVYGPQNFDLSLIETSSESELNSQDIYIITTPFPPPAGGPQSIIINNLNGYIYDFYIQRIENVNSNPIYLGYNLLPRSFDVKLCGSTTICLQPTTPTISNIDINELELNWNTTDPLPNAWEITYSTTANFNPDTATTIQIPDPNITRYVFTGLEANTTYYFRVRAICTSDTFSDWSPEANATTLDCLAPTNLDSTTTDTSAFLSWNNNNQYPAPLGGWEVSYAFGTHSSIDGVSILGSFITYQPEALIEDLVPSNDYTFFVQAICSAISSSDIIAEAIATNCSNCNSFVPQPGKEYVVSAWVKEEWSVRPEVTMNPNTDHINDMLNDLVHRYNLFHNPSGPPPNPNPIANGICPNGTVVNGLFEMNALDIDNDDVYNPFHQELLTTIDNIGQTNLNGLQQAGIYNFQYVDDGIKSEFRFQFTQGEYHSTDNLVLNAGFEFGTSSWIGDIDDGLEILSTPEENHDSHSGLPNTGDYFLWLGISDNHNYGEKLKAIQRVNVSNYLIDNGNSIVTFSGFMRGHDNNDLQQMRLVFYNENNVEVGTSPIMEHNINDYNNDETRWINYTQTLTIPIGTKEVEMQLVGLNGILSGGSNHRENDSFFDDISLTIVYPTFDDLSPIQTFDVDCYHNDSLTTEQETFTIKNPLHYPLANYFYDLTYDCLGNTIESKYRYDANVFRSFETIISVNKQVSSYRHTAIELSYLDGQNNILISNLDRTFYPTGDIIDDWQRIHGVFKVPQNTVTVKIELVNNLDGPDDADDPIDPENPNDHRSDAYFDDVRVFPKDGNMKSFVYDQQTQRLMAELDENNYATFYEYDKEGGLIRVKKETEKGVFTIQETRSGNVKKE